MAQFFIYLGVKMDLYCKMFKQMLLFFFIPLFILFSQSEGIKNHIKLNLDQCIENTLNNNNSRAAFKYDEKIAEARLKQAKSGHYPSLDLTAALTRIDQDPNYIVPSSKIQIPAINLGSLSMPSFAFPIPEQDIKLADKQNIQADLNLVWPIFTGGKISSYVEQAENAIAIAKNDGRLNDDQIIYETKKLYYAAVLATSIEAIAIDTYERLKTILSVSESMYKNGSGRVTKTDYLKNKLMVEAVKTFCEQIAGERKSALAALVNTMGMDWQTNLELADTEIQFNPLAIEFGDLLELMYGSNPLFSKLNNAQNVFLAKIDEAKSGYYPSLALIGGYRRIFNNYDYGMVTPQNKNVWMIGLGLQINIFNGLRTSAAVEENQAEFDKISEQKEYLKKGLTLKLQYLFQKLETAAAKETSSKEAMNSSIENRELIEKAYFNDIMELEDLLQAQLTEALFKVQYQTVLFEHADFLAQIDQLLSKKK